MPDDPAPLTASELAELTRLCEAATAGPWTGTARRTGLPPVTLADGSKVGDTVPALVRRIWIADDGLKHTVYIAECNSHGANNDADAAFIASSREAVPRLLATVTALQDALREALMVVAESHNVCRNVRFDEARPDYCPECHDMACDYAESWRAWRAMLSDAPTEASAP